MNPADWIDVGQAPAITAARVALDFLLAFLLGQWIAFLYQKTHRGVSYSRNLVQSLVLLCMIVALVMLVVGDSVARAFGLVGALAIIRFRTVIRDARDTTFIFLALAVGIAIGAHQYAVAIGGALLVTAAAAFLHAVDFGSRHADTGMLRVRGASSIESSLTALARAECESCDLTSVRETGKSGESEWAFRIRLRDPQRRDALTGGILALVGAASVDLILEEGAEEW